MRNFSIMLGLAMLLAGCETREQSTFAGAATGAAVGAAIADDDVQGAVLGGIAGSVAGNLIGRAEQPGQCRYRDAAGNVYVAPC